MARRALPGFHLSMGMTLTWLSLLVVIPLGALALKALSLTWDQLWAVISSERAVASYRLSFGASLIAASVNAVFGTLIAWVLVRYEFPGRSVVDAIVDLPFALPTAVGGIALTAAWEPAGLVGQVLTPLGLKGAFAPLGVVVALVFIGLPFAVRTVQPVLAELDPALEEASATLGASRLLTFRRVLFPAMLPAIATGFTLAFARAVGEYGSVVFISGNLPFKTEITPLLIMTHLEQFDYGGATALGLVMLLASLALLIVLNLLQRRVRPERSASRMRPLVGGPKGE
ncbi:MAG: sulfate ABC transporter permease subunit CysT [Myxococcales bacterium]